MKLISIISPCFNEEGNVRELRDAIRAVFAAMPQYDYEHIFIDNASRDRTATILRELAAEDKHVRVILNARNFGHIRSPQHALMQTRGDAVICMASDFQDPPALIADFIAKWEQGYRIVLGVKATSDETLLLSQVRRAYYRFIKRLSDIDVVENATGFGLLDRAVVEAMRRIDDPYPYGRGLLAEIGFEAARIPFHKPARRRGITKNNFYTLYDLAMLGITNHSRIPLRIATMLGFIMSLLSLLMAIGYLIAKLLLWYYFPVGIAPVLIVIFFFASVQLFFIGILGEYIGTILTQVQKRPLVIEKERINFDVPGTDAPRASAQPQPSSQESAPPAA